MGNTDETTHDGLVVHIRRVPVISPVDAVLSLPLLQCKALKLTAFKSLRDTT